MNISCVDDDSECGFTPLHFAVLEHLSIDITKLLINNGANVNCLSDEIPFYHADVGYSFATPLHLTVLKGKTDFAELLMRSGANHSIRNFQNKTPLDMAVERNNSAMIKVLLLNGADPDDRCTCGDCVDCQPKSYEFALELKRMTSFKTFLNTTHSF